MRLKVLLGIFVPLFVLSTMAAAAGSQLTDVNVATQGGETVVVLHANGPYTHTEYRPTDTMYLVDLTGVSAGKLAGLTKSVQSTGVASYHVVTYTGTGGAEVTRVEITLAAGAKATVSEEHGALAVLVTTDATAAPTAKPVVSKPPASVVASGKTVKVDRVSVVRGKDGLEVDILANGPLSPKAMLLTGPDRLVVDLANAVPGSRSHEIAVNHDQLKTVRMARYQVNPPMTRVVLDLTAASQYDLVPSGNKLTVKLHSATASVPAVTPAPTEVAATPKPVVTTPAVTTPVQTASTETKPAPTTASSYVFLEPKFEPKKDTPATPQIAHSALDTSSTDAVPLVSGNAALLNASGLNAAFQQQMNTQTIPQGPQSCSRTRYTGDPISVNLKDVDLKDFFRLVHDISRLNIVLDPNVKGSLTIVLDNVPWDQALNIVLRNNGLDCEIDGNVLRIATLDTLKKEADAQRAQIEARALAVPRVTVTRYLNYAHAKDVVPTIKKFLSQRGDVISDDRMNALIIEDIPSYLPNVDRLIKELDRKTPEVEIEARVIAATRSFARDLGVQLGFGWGNASTVVGGAPAVGPSPLSGPTPGIISAGGGGGSGGSTGGTGSPIPLFSNLPAIGPTSGLALGTIGGAYRLDAFLTMAESRGLLKVLARPRGVTQNNIPVLVQQGVRVPVVTQAQLGGPPTVTYVDAFLRLTVTPQITEEKTIFMNVDVENTTPDFGHQVNGNPTLLTAQEKTQVLVTDGGTVVIGGVIQTQNSVTMQQVPLLGNIPILGALFKRRGVSTQTQELIFFITPKIIQT